MAVSLAILLLAVVHCSTAVQVEPSAAVQDYQEDVEFQQWVSQYYRDGGSLAEIYPTWRRNADFVKHHNSLGLSYTLTVNKFAHLVSVYTTSPASFHHGYWRALH